MNRVFIDNNATTFMKKDVIKAINDKNLMANASSMYEGGRVATQYIEDARLNIAQLLDCKSDEILFTSGATEANNTVLNIAKNIVCKNKRNNDKKVKILTSVVEHPSVREVLKKYESEGVDVVWAPVDRNGIVDLKFIQNSLRKGDVAFVTIMSANNETGSIQPVAQICELSHENGALFHTDSTQAVGKIEVSFKNLDADYMSLSAHKVYGPKGIGALIVKKGAPFESFLIGGHQENGRRAGTYNAPAIYGFGIACKLMKDNIDKECRRLKALRARLLKGLKERVSDIVINTPLNKSLVNTLNVSFRNVEGESILLMLDNDGIEVSTGSACATGSLEPSFVLLAQGVKVEDAHGSIRFSFGAFNKKSDVDYVLEKLPPIIEKLRAISTRR